MGGVPAKNVKKCYLSIVVLITLMDQYLLLALMVKSSLSRVIKPINSIPYTKIIWGLHIYSQHLSRRPLNYINYKNLNLAMKS